MHAPQCHTDGMYESITIFYNSWWPLVIASIKLSNDIMYSPVASQSRVVAKYAQRRWGNKTPGETYSVTMTCKLNHVRYLGICVRGNTDIFVRETINSGKHAPLQHRVPDSRSSFVQQPIRLIWHGILTTQTVATCASQKPFESHVWRLFVWLKFHAT